LFTKDGENFIDITIIYYVAQFKHFESSIFRKSAVTNIRKCDIYSRFEKLGSNNKMKVYGSFSDNKIQK
jgi:hypothetical protein